MTKILIIEDDSFKKETLVSIVEKNSKMPTICCVSDVASAINAVESSVFDLIIIDMALPSHPIISGGGSPISLLTGGLEILFELNSLNRTDDCIIVTQYPEIEIAGKFYTVNKAAVAIKKHFSCDVIACLQYSEVVDGWEKILLDRLKHYENSST